MTEFDNRDPNETWIHTRVEVNPFELFENMVENNIHPVNDDDDKEMNDDLSREINDWYYDTIKPQLTVPKPTDTFDKLVGHLVDTSDDQDFGPIKEYLVSLLDGTNTPHQAAFELQGILDEDRKSYPDEGY